MVIDIHVHPAFFEPINEDEKKEELRHDELNLHKNGTAPLKHFFNKMNCAKIDYASGRLQHEDEWQSPRLQ